MDRWSAMRRGNSCYNMKRKKESHSHTYQKYYALKDIEPYEGEKAFLFFEGEQDDSVTPVEASALANMLRDHHIPVAILNACQSGKQVGTTETSLGSSLMQAGVQLVLAMGYSVTVTAAVLLMKTLYQHLFDGNDLTLAIRHARNELYNDKRRQAYYAQLIDLEDWLLPVVYQNRPVQLALRELTQAENTAYYEHKAELSVPHPQNRPSALSDATWTFCRLRNACSPNATCSWCAAWVVRAKPRFCAT